MGIPCYVIIVNSQAIIYVQAWTNKHKSDYEKTGKSKHKYLPVHGDEKHSLIK